MSWFEEVFGAAECDGSFGANRDLFDFNIKTGMLYSKCNGRYFKVGPFESPTNSNLRKRIYHDDGDHVADKQGLTFQNICGDVSDLINDNVNAGSVFQVASQFNCLEMVGPRITPAMGITRYEDDGTQGPACALACPAATVFRNYFINDTGQVGDNQLDLLSDVGTILENAVLKYWDMRNGYALPSRQGAMKELSDRLAIEDGLQRTCIDNSRVGVHWNTEVTPSSARRTRKTPSHGHKICQVFASALPVAYARGTSVQDWSAFAKLVLDAAYDSTLAVGAILAQQRNQLHHSLLTPSTASGSTSGSSRNELVDSPRVTVYLTALGGGAFGNRFNWIVDAIEKALHQYADMPLDVKLVHYGSIHPAFRRLDDWKSTIVSPMAAACLKTGSVEDTSALSTHLTSLLSVRSECAIEKGATLLSLTKGCSINGADEKQAAAGNIVGCDVPVDDSDTGLSVSEQLISQCHNKAMEDLSDMGQCTSQPPPTAASATLMGDDQQLATEKMSSTNGGGDGDYVVYADSTATGFHSEGDSPGNSKRRRNVRFDVEKEAEAFETKDSDGHHIHNLSATINPTTTPPQSSTTTSSSSSTAAATTTTTAAAAATTTGHFKQTKLSRYFSR